MFCYLICVVVTRANAYAKPHQCVFYPMYRVNLKPQCRTGRKESRQKQVSHLCTCPPKGVHFVAEDLKA